LLGVIFASAVAFASSTGAQTTAPTDAQAVPHDLAPGLEHCRVYGTNLFSLACIKDNNIKLRNEPAAGTQSIRIQQERTGELECKTLGGTFCN
jgi:hypothetical protein